MVWTIFKLIIYYILINLKMVKLKTLASWKNTVHTAELNITLTCKHNSLWETYLSVFAFVYNLSK